jgi:hypothetical protein
MTPTRLVAILLATTILWSPLLSGCTEEKQGEEKKKTTLQQQLGQEAAASIEKPLAEARKAAEIQGEANRKIGEAAQGTGQSRKLEGC